MRMTTPLAACLLAALTGCAADDTPPRLVPPSLLAPCPAPVDLPSRGLTGAEVEILWGRDRSALRACGAQIASLSDYME